jgi:HD-like signal output (HDOD) protein
LAAAFGSKILVQQLRPELSDDAFVAGLLHDAGKIILDPYVLERKEEFKKFLKEGQKTFLQAEQEILGFDHAEIMSRATRFWRFSEPQSIAIRFHHHPSLSENDQLAHVVHLADYVAKLLNMGAGGGESNPELEAGVLEFLGINKDALENLAAEVIDSVKKLEEEYQDKAL